MFSLGIWGPAGRAVGCEASSREMLTLAVLFRLAAPWPESETLVVVSVPGLSELSIAFSVVVHGSSVVVVVKWSMGVVVHDVDGSRLMVSSLLGAVSHGQSSPRGESVRCLAAVRFACGFVTSAVGIRPTRDNNKRSQTIEEPFKPKKRVSQEEDLTGYSLTYEA